MPATVILPLSGRAKADSSLTTEVFPAPLAPISATVSPERTEKVNCSTLGNAAPWGVNDTWSTLIARAGPRAVETSSASGESAVPGTPLAADTAAVTDISPEAVGGSDGACSSLAPARSHVTGMPLARSRWRKSSCDGRSYTLVSASADSAVGCESETIRPALIVMMRCPRDASSA